MTEQEFIDTWFHKQLGMALDGVLSNNPERDARLRMISFLPVAVKEMLKNMYRDMKEENRDQGNHPRVGNGQVQPDGEGGGRPQSGVRGGGAPVPQPQGVQTTPGVPNARKA